MRRFGVLLRHHGPATLRSRSRFRKSRITRRKTSGAPEINGQSTIGRSPGNDVSECRARHGTVRIVPLYESMFIGSPVPKTVSKLQLFEALGLLFERKQIPQIVVIVRNSRKTTEPLEPTPLPWAQGVGRSNRPAPTIRISICGQFGSKTNGPCGVVCDVSQPG